MKRSVPQSEISVTFAEKEEGSSILGDISDSLSGVDFPFTEIAKLGFNDHDLII